MKMPVVECFQLYMSLKLHFESDSYDFFKYNGKTKLSDFTKRKDRFQFQKLCRMVDSTEMRDFLVANFAFRDKVWVGDLLDDTAKDLYMKYQRYFESLVYVFKTDLDILVAEVYDNLDDMFKVVNGQHPIILKKLLAGDISILTFTIMDDITGFGKKVNKKIDDDILWPSIYKTVQKLKPFLEYDKVKIREVLVNGSKN